MAFGTKLKQIIKDSGYTLKEISDAIDVPTSTIASWYRSEYPPLEQIIKICDFFKIELWEFFLDDPAKLNKYLPDYIKAEDAAMMKILNTSVDIKTRIEVKKLFIQAMKCVLLQKADQLKHLPEFKTLFGETKY